MRKFLAIAISALFLLGFAASAFAIHAEIPSETQAVVAKGETQITLGGSIRVRGELKENMSYNKDSDCTNCHTRYDGAWWDERVRLSVDAQVADNVRGFVMIEAGDCSINAIEGFVVKESDTWIWGDTCSLGHDPFNMNTHGATGVYGKGNSKRGVFRVLEAWINYTNDIANLKIGHMPLALGNNIFFDHRKFGDDAVVLYKDVDNLHLAALTAKFDELNTAVADDANGYVALFVYKGDGFNVSGDVTWVNDNCFTGVCTTDDADLYNIGIRGDLSVTDTINLRGDIEVQTGDTNNSPGILGCVGNCDFNGYAFMLGGTVKLDPVTLDLEFGLGSGDDNWGDGDIDMFVTSLSSGVPYITFVHGTRSINLASWLGGGGITNLTYLKGTVSGSPMEKTTAKASVIWLKATEAYNTLTGDDDIGVEIDAEVKYQLARNLVYWVEGGYFFVDEAYAQAYGADPGQEADAYAIRHGIELTF